MTEYQKKKLIVLERRKRYFEDLKESILIELKPILNELEKIKFTIDKII